MAQLAALDQRRAHEVLATLKNRADELGLELLVIGATARDIKVALELGLGVERATKDVDVAVHVDSFAIYHRFMSAFTRTTAPQRVLVQEVSVNVVPFGDIERDRKVQLEEGVVLDVVGLREASRAADLTEITPGVMVRVASLEAQMVLKATAWRDRAHGRRNKDAVDLASLLEAADEGRHAEATWADEETMERFDYDPLQAAAFRLGLGGARLFETRTVALRVLETFESPEWQSAVSRGLSALTARERLDAYTEGFRAGLPL